MSTSAVLVVLATFLAAGVEWVEALTIVLAVGLFKGWRSAIAGTFAALVLLAVLVAAFGVAITSDVPIAAARAVVGVFLLLFGLKWLHKAILRSSGLVRLRDEAKAFEAARERLTATGSTATGLDRAGVTTAMTGVFLEGLEVVFIVVALGGLHSVSLAMIGAAGSLIVVVALGAALRRPLTRIPENTMKYVVGIMLTSFGTFFAGEGIGIQWWHQDVSLLFLIAAYGLASLLFVAILRRPPNLSGLDRNGIYRSLRAAALEVWGLFVDDGALAVLAVVVLLGTAVFVNHYQQGGAAAYVLVVGILLAVLVAFSGPIKEARAREASGPEQASALKEEKAPAISSDQRETEGSEALKTT